MAEEKALEKTNRMNLLLDFYGTLLTGKQQSVLTSYFYEDFSLGEIASELDVSRQAVFEHIKRAEQTLEEYEAKLGLLAKYERRSALLERLEKALADKGLADEAELKRLLDSLKATL